MCEHTSYHCIPKASTVHLSCYWDTDCTSLIAVFYRQYVYNVRTGRLMASGPCSVFPFIGQSVYTDLHTYIHTYVHPTSLLLVHKGSTASRALRLLHSMLHNSHAEGILHNPSLLLLNITSRKDTPGYALLRHSDSWTALMHNQHQTINIDQLHRYAILTGANKLEDFGQLGIRTSHSNLQCHLLTFHLGKAQS